jgi:hypothetical protein
MEPSKIVVRYRNGKILKGYTQNFFPNKPVFHVNRHGGTGPGDVVEVNIDDLKAVFFVRDFTGNAKHVERKQLVMVGTTTGYDPKRPAFFLFPIDPSSNNVRIFVVTKTVRTARFL